VHADQRAVLPVSALDDLCDELTRGDNTASGDKVRENIELHTCQSDELAAPLNRERSEVDFNMANAKTIVSARFERQRTR
jgi:hypothetical protein